jgi:calcineurin-like phosphoesterase family protein
MPEHFVISDLHLAHANMCTFLTNENLPARPHPITTKAFEDKNEHDAYIIAAWNSVVKPNDTVYVLGDVVIHRSGLSQLNQLNGRKRLILGNHDIFSASEYLNYFVDVHACLVKHKVIFTHIPIAVECLERFSLNVHGHTHNFNLPNKKYYNVSLEQLQNYSPIPLDLVYLYAKGIQ